VLSKGVTAGIRLGFDSLAETRLAEPEISTLGIVLKALRAATGPGARIMDEYRMNVQVGTKEIRRMAKTTSGRQAEPNQ